MDDCRQCKEFDQRSQYASGEPPSDFNYNRQTPELHVPTDLLSGITHHYYQPFGERFPEPSISPFCGTRDSYPLATYGPPALPPQRDFGLRSPYRSLATINAGQSSPLASAVNRASALQDTVESNQQSFPPSDTPSVRRSQDNIVPSFDHSGMTQSPTRHIYPSAYERNRVPAWKESQYSGEYRRQQLNDRVTRGDYVPVWRGPQDRDSQSSESANSLSSGGATVGSNGRSWDEVMGRCEFCGHQALLSTVQEHWLSCPHRTAAKPTRQGVWMSR